MKLQTTVEIPTTPFKIENNSRVAIVGSCFAEVIGGKFELLGGSVFNNPCGIVYNPFSVSRSLEILHDGGNFSSRELVFRDNLYHSMEHHGKFSAPNAEEVLSKINTPAVRELDYIIVTLGTIYTYFYDGKSVANCHKIPEKEFTRRPLTLSEITSSLEKISALYPTAKIIITVSPIRHLRDGLTANSLSKATLRVAAAEFCSGDPHSRVYFPSYEIVMDELRDYRFTEADMCHPTAQTKGYIWEKFSENFLSSELISEIKSAEKVAARLAHRPLR